MKTLGVCATCFVVVLASANVCSALDGSYSDVIGGKLGFESGKKNVITDTIVNEILNIYAPVSHGFDNDLCRNHSQLYKDSVKNGKLWALQMFDSSSKIPDGLLDGNVVQLGNYDECLGVEDVASEFGAFSGQHCVVTINPSSKDAHQRSVVEMVNGFGMQLLRSEIYDGNPAAKSIAPGVAIGSYQWSMCVPSSCRPVDLAGHLQTALPGNPSVFATALQCNSRAIDRPWAASDWFAVGFMAFFAMLVVSSTTYDLMFSQSESRRPVLAAFSVYSNGAKLLAAPTASSDNLGCLHGVRVLSMAWVVLGHRYMFALMAPSINKSVDLVYYEDWTHIFIKNASLSVDSFLLLSGILVCYVFMKEMEKGTSFNVFQFYIHRYIRLTPPYAVVILLSATLFTDMGDGPLWRSNEEPYREFCQRNWWISLLYVQNYVRSAEPCLGQGWYLGVDMQLFWLSPLVLWPLWKWPKIGKPLVGTLIGVGLLIAFLVAYLNEFPFNTLDFGATGIKQYTPTHTRYTPWMIGVGLGYILHVTKKNPVRMSWRVAALGWLLAAGLMLTSGLLAHRFLQLNHQYERVFESIYTSLFRPAWALGLAWIIYACVNGYGGFINTFLSWSVFQVLGRLTYSVYLIHFAILTWIYSTVKEPTYLSDRNIFLQYFGDMVLSFAAAFVLSLVFESPAIIIEKHLLGGSNKKENRPAKKNDDEDVLQERVEEVGSVKQSCPADQL